ncbi:MAG TPA: S53 family peptidase [Acidimicrobiales bacterium]|nr:S53 family peptidase [Acidimicrobiales bacterium]
MADEYLDVDGSSRPPLTGATPSGPVPDDEALQVTVVLRPDPALAQEAAAATAPVSRAELARLRGADPAELAAVEAFAGDHGLTVEESDRAGRRVVLSGPASAMNDAFGVDLQHFEHPAGRYRGHPGPVRVHRDLADAVVAVLGLDNRPQARAQFRPRAEATGTSYTPPQVAAAYGYPTDLTGAGHAIAFVELGGGYVEADLAAYFSGVGVTEPSVKAVGVDQATNQPGGTADGPDGEVMLDLEVAGSIAHGATLVVYFAPNTDQGFVDAVSAAVHDATNQPAVISISWGGPESGYAASSRQAFENALTDAGLAGVTVCVAAGDNGSSDGVSGGQPTVDYPASSPQVLACGGTSLKVTGDAISSEVVWNDGASGGATGGGVSAAFALPSWQQGVGVPASAAAGGGTGRGVPDVSGNADPATGYQVRVDGSNSVFGGTSAVAPLWSALLILAVQNLGRPLGFINPQLYASYGRPPGQAAGFNDIVSGTNGAYTAGPGWDPCTGLGSPKAAALIAALS